MSNETFDDKSRPIRISYDDVNNPHVDDLLKRQMSLRGESISRDSRGKWYYRNWFLFMIAGMVAAIGAWAIIEPNFDDMPYIQGTVQAMDAEAKLHQTVTENDEQRQINLPASGWLKINNQQVWIVSQSKSLPEHGEKGRVDLSKIKVGQEVGVYVEPQLMEQTKLAVAMFVVPDAQRPAPAKASMSLQDQIKRSEIAGMLLFPVVAAMVGLAIGVVDGIVCRLLRRVLLAGAVGLLVGFIGGFVCMFLANLVYTPLSQFALKQSGDTAGGLSTLGFLSQMGGRGLAWCLAGMAMGLGQGIAVRSSRLLVYGLLGGVIGGLLGGLLFDPIDMLLLGTDKPSAHISRLVGLAVIGACVGAMMGVVELLARDAWLQMVEGPLAGKEFLIFKDTMHAGSSPRCEIYLFNDDQVADQHVVMRSVGDNYEIENLCLQTPACLNGRPIQRARLHHGDRITIGRTVFVFQKRKG